MNQSNEIWCSPWRKLQQLLANQARTVCEEELYPLESDDDCEADGPSWIKRARRRQPQPLRFANNP